MAISKPLIIVSGGRFKTILIRPAPYDDAALGFRIFLSRHAIQLFSNIPDQSLVIQHQPIPRNIAVPEHRKPVARPATFIISRA